MNTDISQNGKDIQLRATKEEFNATNKTLSKTVADFYHKRCHWYDIHL